MARNPRLIDVVGAWKKGLARIEALKKERDEIEKENGKRIEMAQSWIRSDFTTGDPLLDIAIGVYGTIDEAVVKGLELLQTELNLNVGQLILKLQTSSFENRSLAKQSTLFYRLTVGRISRPEIVFDREKNLLAVESEVGTVRAIADKAFFNLHQPRTHRQANFSLNLSREEVLTYGAGRTSLRDGLVFLIGDRVIEDWLTRNAPMILAREESLWAHIVAPLAPPTPASILVS